VGHIRDHEPLVGRVVFRDHFRRHAERARDPSTSRRPHEVAVGDERVDLPGGGECHVVAHGRRDASGRPRPSLAGGEPRAIP